MAKLCDGCVATWIHSPLEEEDDDEKSRLSTNLITRFPCWRKVCFEREAKVARARPEPIPRDDRSGMHHLECWLELDGRESSRACTLCTSNGRGQAGIRRAERSLHLHLSRLC